MKLTGSISRGKNAPQHNLRTCYTARNMPEHIHAERTADNVIFVNRDIKEMYRELFDDARKEYNAKQTRDDRKISDYLEKVRADKRLHETYEFVVQVGNSEKNAGEKESVAMYREWLSLFQQKYGEHFEVKQAIVHLDEAVPHMHFEVVPVAHDCKRGLTTQNSMKKALKQAGFHDYKEMLIEGWDSMLTEVMESHRIERVAGDKSLQMGGVSIESYKANMRLKNESESLTERLECLRQEVTEKERSLGSEGLTVAIKQGFKQARELTSAESASRELESEEKELTADCNELERQRSELEKQADELRGRCSLLERARERLTAEIEQLKELLARAVKRFKRPIPSLASEISAAKRAYQTAKPIPGENGRLIPQSTLHNRVI